MRPTQVEYWANQIIDTVKAGSPAEDSRVELKAKWPADHKKTARQIAGHANAARGEPLLWLIGIDEINGVQSADLQENSTWWPQIEKCFNEVAVEQLLVVNVAIDNGAIVAMLLDTTRAPYVVKNSSGQGNIDFETPYRVANKTLSARRQDLIRILAPLTLLPEIELSNLTFQIHNVKGRVRLWLQGSMYIVPMSNEMVTFPFHKITTRVSSETYGGVIQKGVKVKGKSENVSSGVTEVCLLYTSPSPRDATLSRMPSSA